MPTKRFVLNGEEWEVEMTGTAVGAGASAAGYEPRVSRWSVVFRSVKDPSREVRGQIGASDLSKLSDQQLVKELERALRSRRKS